MFDPDGDFLFLLVFCRHCLQLYLCLPFQVDWVMLIYESVLFVFKFV